MFFYFLSIDKGFEQGGSNEVAEENSPVDCFRQRANERSEAIEAAASEKSLALRQKIKKHPCGVFYFLTRVTAIIRTTVYRGRFALTLC